MTMKSDKWIKSMCEGRTYPMVEPFYPKSISNDAQGRDIPSYGLSSYGYDMRLGRTIHLFKTNTLFEPQQLSLPFSEQQRETRWRYCRKDERGISIECSAPIQYTDKIIDLHDPDYANSAPAVILEDVDWIDLLPGAFILGHTEEYTRVPRDVSVTCMGKSTIARLGIIVTVTPLEAGWEGITTLEITNTTPNIVRLYTGWGICQMQFIQSDEECEVSYADRKGKYQFQGKLPVQAKV